MTLLVTIVGALIVLIGLIGLVNPRKFISLVGRWQGASRLWSAALIRIALGVGFIIAAPSCRLPEVVRIIGIISLVAGVVIPFIGRRRFDSFIDWWLGMPTGVIRIWSLAAAVFGVVLVYAAG